MNMASFYVPSFRLLFTNTSKLLCSRWSSSFGRGDPVKNYYKVLDVDPKADEKTIKSAFYAQSKKLHPDVTPDDELAPDKFKELVEAYEVLGDTKKRQEYDNVVGTNSKEETSSSAQDTHSDPSRPRYGVDPRIMRNIKVDLSEERMRYAWTAYKERWAREEEHLNNLSEQKKIFRMEIDKKRSMYQKLSIEEKETIKENIRLFRHPKFMKKESDFKSDVNGAKERKEGFYSDLDSKPFPSKSRYSDFKENDTNFENEMEFDQVKKNGPNSRSDSKPEYRHPNPMKTETSLGDDIKADHKNRQRFYSDTESNDQEPSGQSESFVKEVGEKLGSFYTNSNAKSAKEAKDDSDDDFFKNSMGQNPVFEGREQNRESSSSSRSHEELLREMEKKSQHLREHWKSASGDGTKDVRQDKLAMFLIALFMGIVLIERNANWTSENTYVYLQKKPKQNDSESK